MTQIVGQFKFSVFKALSDGCRNFANSSGKSLKCGPKVKKTKVGKTGCKRKADSKSKNKNPLPGKEKGSPALLFRNISYGVMTCILGLTGFVFTHLDHHEREPFVPYQHLRLRNKPFFFGDGKKTAFHNSKINALPEGYEDELTEEKPEENEKKGKKGK